MKNEKFVEINHPKGFKTSRKFICRLWPEVGSKGEQIVVFSKWNGFFHEGEKMGDFDAFFIDGGPEKDDSIMWTCLYGIQSSPL